MEKGGIGPAHGHREWEKALANGSDYAARANLLLSCTYALNGTLPNGVTTDWATHAIEHEVSAIYDIAHGAGLRGEAGRIVIVRSEHGMLVQD